MQVSSLSITATTIWPWRGSIANELTCKTLYKRGAVVKLQAANPDFPDLLLREGQTLTLWGVVTSVIKKMPV